MTCQYCQTWNTDDEHRCRRCGRLLQDMPGPPAGRSYAVSGAATAAAAAVARREQEPVPEPRPNARVTAAAQPALFETTPEPRVIPFNSLTSPKERHAIQERMEGLANSRSAARQADVAQQPRRRANPEPQSRPVSRAAVARAPKPRPLLQNQQSFHFADESELAPPPAPVISCDAAVAPPVLRIQAALIDALCMLGAAAFAFTPILIWARPLSLDRWTLGWCAALLTAIVAAYPLIWIICGADSVGARAMRLSLVGLDGTSPDSSVRYKRLFAMMVSILAVGVGLLWALFDEDRLTWHDHMSGTFPAIAEE